jgi:hypothetical protein
LPKSTRVVYTKHMKQTILEATLRSACAQGGVSVRAIIAAQGGKPCFQSGAAGFCKLFSAQELSTLIPAALNPLTPDGLILLQDCADNLDAKWWGEILACGLKPDIALLDARKLFITGATHNKSVRIGLSGGFGFGLNVGSDGGAGVATAIRTQPIMDLFDAVIVSAPFSTNEQWNSYKEQLGGVGGEDEGDEFGQGGTEMAALEDITKIAPGAGDSLAHWAAASGNEALLKVILERAPAAARALNAKKQTPLHVASLFLQNGAAELLMEAGGLVDARCQQGYTPLAMALLFSEEWHSEVRYNDKAKEQLHGKQILMGCKLLARGANYDKGPGRSLQDVLKKKDQALAEQLRAEHELFKMSSFVTQGAAVGRHRL